MSRSSRHGNLKLIEPFSQEAYGYDWVETIVQRIIQVGERERTRPLDLADQFLHLIWLEGARDSLLANSFPQSAREMADLLNVARRRPLTTGAHVQDLFQMKLLFEDIRDGLIRPQYEGVG